MIALSKIRRFAVTALVVCAFAADPAAAQSYPTGPIRIVVGFGPGSTADALARLVGNHIGTALGQPVVVENRPGNSSMLARSEERRVGKECRL